MIRVSTDGKNYFDANSPRYRSCCCHVKTFTWVWVIIEGICLLLSCISTASSWGLMCSPSHWDRLEDQLGILERNLNDSDTWEVIGMGNSSSSSMQEVDGSLHDIFKIYRKIGECMCDLSAAFLSLYVLHFVLIALILLGLSKEKWKLFVPYLVVNGVGLVVSTLLLLILLVALCTVHVVAALIVLLVCAPFYVLMLYVYFLEFRCCQFFKEKDEFYARAPSAGGVAAFSQGGYPTNCAPLPPIGGNYAVK